MGSATEAVADADAEDLMTFAEAAEAADLATDDTASLAASCAAAVPLSTKDEAAAGISSATNDALSTEPCTADRVSAAREGAEETTASFVAETEETVDESDSEIAEALDLRAVDALEITDDALSPASATDDFADSVVWETRVASELDAVFEVAGEAVRATELEIADDPETVDDKTEDKDDETLADA